MKKANFTTLLEKLNRTVSGTVSQDSNGKVSISIMNSSAYSPHTRYCAKKIANEIVDSNFNHKDITYFEDNTAIKSLLPLLIEKTKDFKDKYISLTKERSLKIFEYVRNKTTLLEKEWFEKYEVEYIDYVHRLEAKYPNRNNYINMRKDMLLTNNIFKKGFEKFENEEVDYAIKHYETSLQKLSERLKIKGVDGDVEITTIGLGVNIEMIIKHGKGITKAFTIVAEGEIQRIHYRYLIK